MELFISKSQIKTHQMLQHKAHKLQKILCLCPQIKTNKSGYCEGKSAHFRGEQTASLARTGWSSGDNLITRIKCASAGSTQSATLASNRSEPEADRH